VNVAVAVFRLSVASCCSVAEQIGGLSVLHAALPQLFPLAFPLSPPGVRASQSAPSVWRELD
jgi:hypothetical protein